MVILNSCQKKEEQKIENATVNTDPLPSWNDGETKRAILDFVDRVTNDSSTDFIPVKDRIATFDNDGTLWAEKPYVQELFVFYRVKKMVDKNPALAKKQPFRAVIEKDKSALEKGGDKFLIELLGATHTGLSENEFEKEVNAVRDVNFSKELNPELQSFEQWLQHNAKLIPVE